VNGKSRPRAQERARLAATAQKRRTIQVVVAVVIVAALVVGVLVATLGGDDGSTSSDVKTDSTSVSSTPPTTQAAMASAAGKPCVAEKGPGPSGAPEVPVKVGPPPTTLVKEDLKVGTGAEVTPGATVTVNYIGVSCSTGAIFDASYGREPATFPLSGVIPGWQDGIPGMKVGGTRLLGIPPAQAYGAAGSPPDIAPDETLWFVVELLETKAS
jgi:peptidylprolyl isomerase